MRPRIRYCVTPAGRVAYSTAGAGPALVCDSGWITDLRAQLELFSFGSFIERLAERFTVIRFDKPGCGLSDREGADLSFDGQVAAALAVADAVGAGRFRLFGASQGGQVAATIAARNPDRVEAIVVYGMCACGGDLAPAEVRRSIVALVRAHWGLGLKALAGAFVNDPTAEDMAAFTRFERTSASPAVAAGLLEVYYDTDIRALLPAVRARTAVLHREADKGTRFELGREVAALIPGATLIPLPGSSHLFYHGDWETVLDAMTGFLREPASPGPRLTGRELEVAELVAAGLTNHSIARRPAESELPVRATLRRPARCAGDLPGERRPDWIAAGNGAGRPAGVASASAVVLSRLWPSGGRSRSCTARFPPSGGRNSMTQPSSRRR